MTAREALERIRDAHDRDPHGGMGWRDDGDYGVYENACLVCGTADEYAVEWPCYTRTLAEAGLKALGDVQP